MISMQLNVSRDGDKIFLDKAMPTDMGFGEGIYFVGTQHPKRSQM